MTPIATWEAALAAIWARSHYDRGFISNPFAGDDAAKLGLRRTQAMLDRLGNPERACPIVHVAGSKGKGSTCVFVDAILRASGRRTGRYLSPHLHTWRERFVVDGDMISEATFIDLTRDAVAAATAIEHDQPELGAVTAFELTTAMALDGFARARCDVAVVEVGLGGTLDATNVVTPAVSVITPLDYEHTAILGETMNEIAANKAGIIKQGRPVVSATQPEAGLAVIAARADACSAPLLVAGRDFSTTGSDRNFTATGPWGVVDHLHASLAGRHQAENATVAIATAHLLDGPALSQTAIRTGVDMATLPARFEEVSLDDGRVVVIDGAHSTRSATALATALTDRYPGESPLIVAGLLRDKQPAAVLSPLIALTDRWIVTAPDTPRALPAGEVAAFLATQGVTPTASASVADAIAAARRSPQRLIVVTGSLTTAAEARVALGLA